MTIKIGTKIRKLRNAKGITQEKLAEYLGVSCQAVSKWESENSYPDIELIPALSGFFGVSSDELFGLDVSKNDEIAAGYIKRCRELKNDPAAQLDLMREAAARFPSSFTVLQHLMYALVANIHPRGAFDATGKSMVSALNALREKPECDGITTMQTALKQEENHSLLSEATAVAELIMEDCTDIAIRHSAIQVLCYFYPLAGKTEQARRLAESMPPLFMCREFLMEDICGGEEKIERIQHSICLLTDYLCCEICAVADPDLQQKNTLSLAEKIHMFDLANKIYELVFENGDYGVYHCRLAFNCRIMAALALLGGQPEDGLTYLERAAAHAVAADTLPEIQDFTSHAVNRLTHGGRGMDDDADSPDFLFHQKLVSNRIVLKFEEIPSNQSGILLRKLEQSRWDHVRDTARFKSVVDQLSPYKKGDI